VYAFLISSLRTACHAHLILHFITRSSSYGSPIIEETLHSRPQVLMHARRCTGSCKVGCSTQRNADLRGMRWGLMAFWSLQSCPCPCEAESRKENRKWRGSGDTTFNREKDKFWAMNVPRQCPLVLQAQVDWKEGKAFGSGESRVIRGKWSEREKFSWTRLNDI
jgi:hypothetical protein